MDARLQRGWLRAVGEDMAAVTARIEADRTFPLLGPRRGPVIVNRRTRP